MLRLSYRGQFSYCDHNNKKSDLLRVALYLCTVPLVADKLMPIIVSSLFSLFANPWQRYHDISEFNLSVKPKMSARR